jgi:hypothetical protein
MPTYLARKKIACSTHRQAIRNEGPVNTCDLRRVSSDKQNTASRLPDLKTYATRQRGHQPKNGG